MHTIIRLVILLFLLASTANAATYYVDYVGGSATAAGTSTSTAWQYAPGDSRFAAACTGNCATTWTAAGSRLNAGDKVIFKGDVTYSGSLITTTWAGSAGNPIVYDGDSGTIGVARWGSGTAKAIIDGLATYHAFSNSTAYVTINYFELKNGPTTRAVCEGYGMVFNGGNANNVIISNNTIHDVGDFGHGTYTGNCIWSDGSDYLKIQNNTIYNCGDTGIYIKPSSTHGSHLEISGNNLTDKLGWGIGIVFAGGAATTDWNIFNNTIHDLTYYDATFDAPHLNYMFIYTGTSYTITGVSIYNNLLYTDGTAVPSSGAIHFETADGGSGGFDNLYIYNNVMKNISGESIYISNANGPYNGIYIYNNSIFQPSVCTNNICGGIELYGSGSTYSNVNIKNNIIDLRYAGYGNALVIDKSITTTLNIDYNLYYLANTTDAFQCDGVKSWTDFKTCTGNAETNSIGLTTDPLYTDVTASGHNLALQLTSPAIGTGATLGAPYNADILGNARPQGASYDIGAYEYVSEVEEPWTLYVSKVGNGTVTSDVGDISCGVVCSDTYAESAVVTLTGVPDAGYYPAVYSGDCSGAGVVTLDTDKVCTVTFAKITSELKGGTCSGGTIK